MDNKEMEKAVFSRHSVRQYKEMKLEEGIKEKLLGQIEEINHHWGLSFKLITDERESFSGFLAHYGKFTGVSNYLLLAAKPRKRLNELTGYYGEKLVLSSQAMGLNSCWVALTYSKKHSKTHLQEGEKLVCAIALGYGENQGNPHKSKPLSALWEGDNAKPDWFIRGMEFAQSAPTAMNQQRFKFSLSGDTVTARSMGGFYSDMDLGIVRLHFELGAGIENFRWGNEPFEGALTENQNN